MAQPPLKPSIVDTAWASESRDVTDRAHAVYAIARHLEALKLHLWTNTVLVWLANYDGFEVYMPDECDPVMCVRDLLGRYATRDTLPELGRLVVDLLEMPFLYYRAAWVHRAADRGTRRDWMPLTQPWLEFVADAGRDEEIEVWRASEPFPPPEILRAHLWSNYTSQSRPIRNDF